MRIVFFSLLLASSVCIKGMRNSTQSHVIDPVQFKEEHIRCARKILELLRTKNDPVAVHKGCALIEYLMKEYEHDAQLLIVVLNKCGIVSELRNHANANDPYACYLLCYLLEDKHKDERKIRAYLKVASAQFPRAAFWYFKTETDPAGILQAIDLCIPHIPQFTDQQIETIGIKLRIMLVQGKHGACARFIRLAVTQPSMIEEVVKLFAQKIKTGITTEIYEALDMIHRELRSSISQEPVLCYLLGCLYTKRAANHTPKAAEYSSRAEEYYHDSQQLGYLPAAWKWLAVQHAHNKRYDEKFEQLEDLVDKTRAFLAEKGSTVISAVPYVTQEARSVITIHEKASSNFAQKDVLARLYYEGISGIIKADEKKASIFLADRYMHLITEKYTEEGFVQGCAAELKKLESDRSPQAGARRKVLTNILTHAGYYQKNREAFALLCRMYAFGLYGVEQDSDELIKTCIAAHTILKDASADQLKQFLDDTQLAKLLESDDGEPDVKRVTHRTSKPVDYFILGLMFGSQGHIEPSALAWYKSILLSADHLYGNSKDYGLLYLMGTIDHLLTYLQPGDDLDTACFIASLLIDRSHRDCRASTSQLHRAALRTTIDTLTSMFMKDFHRNRRPFIERTDETEILRNACEKIVGRHYYDEQEIIPDVLKTFALIELFVGADYLSDSFCRGVSIINQLAEHDRPSKVICEILHNHLKIRLLTLGTAQKIEKLQCYFALIFTESFMHNGIPYATEHFRKCIEYVRNGEVTEYEEWVESYNLPDLLGHIFEMPTDTYLDIGVKVRFHIYMAAHYSLIADFTSNQDKAMSLKALAKTFIDRGYSINRLMMGLALTSEYILGRAVPKNLQEAATFFNDVTMLLENSSLSSGERDSVIIHCRELIRAAPELGIQGDPLLDELKKVALKLGSTASQEK